MAVSDSVDPGTWFAEQIGACEPDLLRTMVKTMGTVLRAPSTHRVPPDALHDGPRW
jgi:putative transposase